MVPSLPIAAWLLHHGDVPYLVAVVDGDELPILAVDHEVAERIVQGLRNLTQ